MTLDDPKYRMSFSVGGLMLNESLVIAEHFRSSESWGDARVRLLDEGASSFPKLASKTRAIREVFDRVTTLTEEERDFLLHDADRMEKQAIVWLSICRTYRFIREFAIDEINERYKSWRLVLDHAVFDRFFAQKAELHAKLDALSPSTRLKLRQVLFRMLREADLVSSDETIQPVWLSGRLKRLIEERNPRDLQIFPGN